MGGFSSETFDPRSWNLLAGAALIAGCSSRLSSDGADETSTDESGVGTTDIGTSTSDTGEDTTETGEPGECVSDQDCFGTGYYYCHNGACVECINYCYQWYGDVSCINNMCVPEPPPPPECSIGPYYENDECPQYQFCFYDYCGAAGIPISPECDPGLTGIPSILDPGALPLALSFVDVDDDGLDELAVATETQLLVYEWGVLDPTATIRDVSSDTIQSMVSARFDEQLGEDLMLLANDDAHFYFSDGMSAFANFSMLPAPLEESMGLLAGNFDGQPPDDAWIWGDSGALLFVGSDLLGSPAAAVNVGYGAKTATTFDSTSLYASLLIGLLRPYEAHLRLFGLGGDQLLDVEAGAHSAVAVSSSGGEGLIITAIHYTTLDVSDSWYVLRPRDPVNLSDGPGSFLRAGWPTLYAGDFDGDQQQEVLAADDEFELVLDVFDDPCILPLELGIEPAPIPPAVGDHDGDGDDEFAVITAAGEVIVVDVE